MPMQWIAYVFAAIIAAWHSPSFAADAVFGEWREYWGTTGKTDVKYNDQYRITRTADSTVSIEIRGKKHKIEEAQVKENGLAFTQHTAFTIRYALMLQDDGRTMVGTATTPRKVVNIRWEKITP